MSQQLQIQENEKAGTVLNKEQKRFNQYVKKIKELRLAIEAAGEADLLLRREGDARIRPAENTMLEASYRLLIAMHNTPLRHELTAKQKEKHTAIILEEAQTLLDTPLYSEDAELHAIYSYYNDGRSYADIQAEQEQATKNMASEMLNQMFGMNIEESDFDDPAKMQEKILEKKAAFEAERAAQEEARAQQKANRKKTPAQLAAEAKRAAAEQSVNKTAKQIYTDLVKNFHPDREQDEVKRAEKTEIMKQITAAYDADDHLQLLELQMNLLSRENVFAQFDNSQLKYFNEILRRQVAELQQEFHMAEPDNNGNPYAQLYHPARWLMDTKINQHVAQVKGATESLMHCIALITTIKGLKEYVKGYQLSEDDDDFMPMNFFDLFGR